MAKTPMTYFSSDFHFNHWSKWTNDCGEIFGRGIISFERTQFNTIQEHDDYLVNMLTNWAKKWAAGSTFWFLGDFGDLDYLWVFDMFIHKGIEVNFLLGNHDKVEDIPKIQMYVSKVYQYPVFLSQKLVVSHFPVAVYEDSINVCGHLHGSRLQDKNHVIASVHVANYNPISEKQLSAIYKDIPKFNRCFLYEPYAADYVFTQPKADVIMDPNGRIDLSASRVYMQIQREKDENTFYRPYVGGLDD